ncbi:hypothetical protein CGRA01v4_09092 [Colletotrichum graminicola]|nr:hypothetical protein CGRA01v4_09092 [Colletotrichum graminicola]
MWLQNNATADAPTTYLGAVGEGTIGTSASVMDEETEPSDNKTRKCDEDAARRRTD